MLWTAPPPEPGHKIYPYLLCVEALEEALAKHGTRLPRWNYARTYRVDYRMALTRRKAKRAAKRYWPLGAAAVGLLALVLAWMLVPAAEWIDSLGQKVAELGWAGPIIYFVLYVIGTIFPVSYTHLTLPTNREV